VRTIRSGRQEFCPRTGQSAKSSRGRLLLLGWRFSARRFLLSQSRIRKYSLISFPDSTSRCVGCIGAAILFTNLCPREAPSVVERRREKLRRTGQCKRILGRSSVGLAPGRRLALRGIPHWDWIFVHTFGPNCYGERGSLLGFGTTRLRNLSLAREIQLVRSQRIYIAWKDESYRLAGFSVLRRPPRNPQKSFMRDQLYVPAIESLAQCEGCEPAAPRALAKLETPQPGRSLRNRRERCLRAKKFFRNYS